MFEKIVLRRSESGPALTLGEIAEALLFYQNIHIVLDFSSLSSLIDQIGMRGLIDVIKRKNISALYCEESLGTQTQNTNGVSIYSLVAFSFTGDQTVGHLATRNKRLEHMLERRGYDRKLARKLVEEFRKEVPIRKLTDDFLMPGGIVRAAYNDLHDGQFLQGATKSFLLHMAGSGPVPDDIRFQILGGNDNFYVDTNIDFDEINRRRRLLRSDDGDITPAHILSEILYARGDTALAAHYGGEFYTSSLSSEIIRLRHDELLRRIGIEARELRSFTEVTLSDLPSVRDVINGGERSFDEFLILLDKSQRFRDWIQDVNPDENLVRSYLQDVTAEGWISRLPARAMRYLLGSMVGFMSPIAGLGLSAADTFLLDKIGGGWRPSHFVEHRLKPFLQPNGP